MGVQASMVMPVHTEVTGSGDDGAEARANVATVLLVSMMPLKMKETAAVGDTPAVPLAGVIETRVGGARVLNKPLGSPVSELPAVSWPLTTQ